MSAEQNIINWTAISLMSHHLLYMYAVTDAGTSRINN